MCAYNLIHNKVLLNNNIIAELHQKACEISTAWIIIAFACPEEWSTQVSSYLLTKHFEQEASLHQHGIKSASKHGNYIFK